MVTGITNFSDKIISPLIKKEINVLQINLGKRCNLACSHCHVEAGPKRTEELSLASCLELIQFIYKFPQIKIVDFTGGAPEMNFGFKPLVETARLAGKEVIVRSNLTIFFVEGFTDIPEFLAQHQVHIVASLPCYLADNVDKMRGHGVFDKSIQALQWLNTLGYGKEANLILDLVYNPQLPKDENFSLTPDQKNLEVAYKNFLQEYFNIVFNNLLTITNLPIGRTKLYLERQHFYEQYLHFLESHFNPKTLDNLMCRQEISVDYLGNIYDCDFNQMMNLPAKTKNGEVLTIRKLLEVDSLDLIKEVQTADYCYGCTAGCGSSCGGALA